RRDGRLDYSGDDLHARIQRDVVSLQPGLGTARAAALFSVSRRHARPRRRHRSGDLGHLGHLDRHRPALLALGIELNRRWTMRIDGLNNPVASSGVSELGDEICLKGVTPRTLSGVQFRTRLDSRLTHAGMTAFG